MKHVLTAFLILINLTVLKAQTAGSPSTGPIHLIDSAACMPVEDQGTSPTCWVFGTNSLFESDLIKKYDLHVNLSEMFIARYAYVDKIKQYLATNGATYCEGGGQFHDVIRVVRNVGMVPEVVYKGMPNGESSYNHAALDTAMKMVTQQFLHEGKTVLNKIDLQQLYDSLDKYLGKVPAAFWYRQKQYTPLTFAKEVVKFDDDYMELVSFANQPLYKKFVLIDKYNWARDSFYNITLDDMHRLVDTALAKGWSVGWEGDVTESGFNYYAGFAAFPDSLHHYDEERIVNYKNESTERDHMLQIVGIGRDQHNKKWYYMKNSWGRWFSPFQGYLYMEENYFKLKTVILFVNKRGLPGDLAKELGVK